ncbi:MAG TPA: nuclear transport factor 2 family protein [Longimicrobium sp.]|nr:nuclear transport factor 2 family protein [Longimicrobium sp.]
MTKTVLFAAMCAGALARGAAGLRAADRQEAVRRAITRGECLWARAYVARDAGAIRGFEAAEFTGVYPDGSMGSREHDADAVTSGRVRITSFKPLDVHVRRYGNVAVATGHSAISGSAMGEDFGGVYAWTDTWVMRNGRWLAVAAQATRVRGNPPPPPAHDICAD